MITIRFSSIGKYVWKTMIILFKIFRIVMVLLIGTSGIISLSIMANFNYSLEMLTFMIGSIFLADWLVVILFSKPISFR